MSVTRIEVKDLVIRYGEAVAVNGVSFTVDRGEHVTLLGPSGCGKTTTLRAIAGLEQPVSGSIRIDGHAMYDASERRNIPTEQRGVSMVFQSYAVWPHMTVFDNVAYGLRVRKQSAADIKANAERALDLVQMRHLAERPASKLSGGQQQRVALARALAFSPTVVLFDEPLSNLDAKLRAEMRVELRELQRRLDITSVYVTHDQEEALAISDRVIVMNVGVIEQIGTPEQIYNRPRSRFVADFVGSANIIKGRLSGDGLFATDGGVTLKATCRAQAARQGERSRDPHGLYRPRSAARRQPRARHGAAAPVPRRLRAIRHRQRAGLAERPPPAGQPAGRGCGRDAVVLTGALRSLGSVRERGPLARIMSGPEARAPIRPAPFPPRSRDASAGARPRDSRRWPCAWCSGCPR